LVAEGRADTGLAKALAQRPPRALVRVLFLSGIDDKVHRGGAVDLATSGRVLVDEDCVDPRLDGGNRRRSASGPSTDYD
jgi:hypothetical protein